MRRKIIKYNPKLKGYAAEMRKTGPVSEIILWKVLKGKQMYGYDFHRQVPIDEFIVDFYCHELKLAIEIDGISHFFKEEYDKERQKKLENLGVRFLRFADEEIYYFLEHSIKAIEKRIIEVGGKLGNTPP